MTATQADPTTGEATVQSYLMRIGGQWLDAADGRRFETVNPFTGQAWASVPDAGAAD
ncbi:MAG: (Z)-2-((N-methylformamido)methylene)-5-hydroxybutyrolactone dehydrogenase, partial [Pseudonocardiales bacterium]|nr:(Z)-2-((N-methylformamido)methylene)-5-hydroxybutyrolactone dehydrogenase [Pseudonocardiales bacterium]